MGREFHPEVRERWVGFRKPTWRSGFGLEAHPKVREGRKPTQRSGRGQEAHPMVREGSEAHPEVWEWSRGPSDCPGRVGGPPGGLGVVGRPTRMSWRG